MATTPYGLLPYHDHKEPVYLGDMLRLKDTFGKGVPAFTFQDWLKDQLHADLTWDSLVRAMLTAISVTFCEWHAAHPPVTKNSELVFSSKAMPRSTAGLS